MRPPIRAAMLCAPFLLAVSAGWAGQDYPAADFTPDGTFLAEVFRSLDAVGFVLVTLLVILLGMCVDLFNHLRLNKLIPEGLLADVQEEMGNGEYEKAMELCDKSTSLIGQIFAAALSKTDYSFERMEAAMQGEAEIQGLIWRQWVRQFRMLSLAGFLFGLAGALIQSMRLVADLAGRPNVGLALASSFEMRGMAYNILVALFLGTVMALVALMASAYASSKLEKILLESKRLGEELLDPFRPLPLVPEE